MDYVSKEVIEGLRVLAIEKQYDAIYNASTYEGACARLLAVQALAKQRFRQVALDYHPDRTGGDKIKASWFVAANNAIDFLKKVSVDKYRFPIPKPEPIKQPVVIRKRHIELIPPIPWQAIPYELRYYFKSQMKHRKINYCYFFCTANTCRHGSFTTQQS